MLFKINAYRTNKVCKFLNFFVVPGSSQVLLIMPFIETLGVLTMIYNTIGRQLASDNKANKRQRNCQYERAVQTEGWKLERCAYDRQIVDAQKLCNVNNGANTAEWCIHRGQHVDTHEQHTADSVDEPDVVPNSMAMGNNNHRNQSLLSDLIIRENQNFFQSNLEKMTLKQMRNKQTEK